MVNENEANFPEIRYVEINPKLLAFFGSEETVFTRSEDGTLILFHLEDRNEDTPALYMEPKKLKDLSERVAKRFKSDLHLKLKEDGETESEVSQLVTEWVDISIDDSISNDKEIVNFGAINLKEVISELLQGYKKDNFGNLMREVDKLDYSTAQHSIEIMFYVVNYFESQKIDRVDRRSKVGALAALLHDVGKQTISDKIILKAGPLDDEELKTIKNHPDFGKDVLDQIDFKGLGFSDSDIKDIYDAEYQHHEREDGSGYPLGLKREEISENYGDN